MNEEKVCYIRQISRMLMAIAVSTASENIECVDQSDTKDGCIKEKCSFWQETYRQEQREGHSGGREAILKRGVETKRTARQDYPYWILDATGQCGLINK